MGCSCLGSASKGATPGSPGIESESTRPNATYQTLTAADDGTVSDRWILGEDGGVFGGWEIQLATARADGARLVGTILADAWWQADTQLTITGWDLNRGGRLYLPWPRVSISIVDAAAPDNGAESLVHGYAVPRSGPVLGGTVLYGRSVADIGASASNAFTVPAGATGYRVVPAEVATALLTVTVQDTPTGGGAAEVWETFAIDPSLAVNSGGGPLAGWGPIPPVAAPVVSVANADAINARSVAVIWRFDLLGVL